MEEVVLQERDADDWIYKGEGAANLILSYTGSLPSMLGKVLRAKKILKILKDEEQPESDCLGFSSSDHILWGDDLTGSLKQEVMSQHLSTNYFDGGVRTRVSKKFLEIVAKNVHSSRPASRVFTSLIDTTADYALLVSDHSVFAGNPSGSNPSGSSCIAVEIKPGCGFLPSSDYISKQKSVKKQVTRYQMHRHLKFHQGQISKKDDTDYNPLDLFSGSKERIGKAIKSLFSTPQSNIRCFVDGSLRFDGMGACADPEKCLEELSKDCGLQLCDVMELLSQAITKSTAMDRLLATQKLDVLDIEGAIHLYHNLISQPCLVCHSVTDAELLKKYSDLHSMSWKKSCYMVRDFLVAAMAKDCSLMMCFRPSQHEASDPEYDSVFLESMNQTFDYKIYFVDHDVEPLDKMADHYKLDHKIVNWYSKSGGAGYVSCDPPKGGGTAASRVTLPRKGGKKEKKEMDAAESSGPNYEDQERDMEKEEADYMRKLPSIIKNLPILEKSGSPLGISQQKALLIANFRSQFMLLRQVSIKTLPRFLLDVNCSVEEFLLFVEARRYRAQFVASLFLVNGIVATPPGNHILFQLIELVEKLEGETEARSLMQFVICEINNYVGGFRPTPLLDAYEKGGFFTFPNMDIPLPEWLFGEQLVMLGHSESYTALSQVEFRPGLLKVMVTRLKTEVTRKNYKKKIPKRAAVLEAPMVLFGEGLRSREILELVVGTPFGALLAAKPGSEASVPLSLEADTLIHNWSALSKVALQFFLAILELQMNLFVEARVSFRRARDEMRFAITKMRRSPRKVDLNLMDVDGVFSLKRLLGHYVTLAKYNDDIVLRSIIRKKLNFRGIYDRCGEAKSDEYQRLLKPWDLSTAMGLDDDKEWERWLTIKRSNLDLLASLMI